MKYSNPQNYNSYYFDGSSFVVENVGASDLNVSFTDTAHTVNINADSNVQSIFKDDSEIDISGSGKNAGYSVDVILNEGNYKFSPHYRWRFDGTTRSNISVKQTDKGMLLSSGSGVDCKVTTYDAIYNEEDSVKDMESNCCTADINSAERVMVYFDENNKLKYHEVAAGDVNADGNISVADAVVLQKSLLEPIRD